MKYNILLKNIIKQILIALIAVAIGGIIRKLFLTSLEEKLVWLTFYPVIMAASLFGGFFCGLLASLFTCYIAIFQYSFFTSKPFIHTDADVIGLYVFIFNTLLMSSIAEYSIWQRKKANIAKQQAEISKEQAEFANKAKSTFLANMSHELRTPLNAILGFTSFMRLNKSLPDQELKNLEIINRSGQFLLNLINNVLDLSKIESGKVSLEMGSFNLRNTINDVRIILSQRAELKGLEFICIIDENVPNYIYSDGLKIKQILINLLTNAVKFTETGYVSLKVYIIKNVNQIVFEVKDSGIGISIKDQKRVFDPFVQVGNLSISEGTGLGLTICKQFIDLLSGEIQLESEEKFGSKFIVKIPFRISEKKENDFDYLQNVKSIAPDQPDFKILIVEDQYENWILLQNILENIGINNKVAENGAEAIDIFKNYIPDLIFMDVRMPGIDGIEATKIIRKLENGKNVKIIGVSAHVFQDEIESILAAGMNDFIKKPYHFSEIYQSLQKHLDVKFIFNEEGNLKIENKVISSEMLKSIDREILIKLKENIEKLNYNELIVISEEITKTNKEIGDILIQNISNYQITSIFRILNQILL